MTTKGFSKTYQGQTFIVQRTKAGFSVSCFTKGIGSRFKDTCKTAKDAALWIWNMADNHDISDVVIERFDEVFRPTRLNRPYYSFA